MADAAIKAENLGKKYFIRHIGEGRDHYLALRDIVAGHAKRIGRQVVGRLSSAPRQPSASRAEEFWALDHVSFEIKEGSRVGIIGRNGAGKSTLLKILSRIVEPSSGRVTMNGRVASLLEVGTGFHQELTGRENIFFNGSILGMSNQEIRRKFDSIVDFSEIERFLDTPVKRYSSGMYVRLAFAVAAHLEPEILIVDEVLAVGDAQFQAKCLGKMKDVGAEGRTVLFVSHNMNAIEQLCDSCMLIDKGRLKRFGDDVRGVIREYLVGDQTDDQPSEWVNGGKEFENPWFTPTRFYVGDRHGALVQNPVRNDDDLWLQVEGTVSQLHRSLALQYTIYNEDDILIYHCSTLDTGKSPFEEAGNGNVTVRTRIPSRLLNEGRYRIDLSVFLHKIQHITQWGKDAPSIAMVIHGGLSDSPHWIEKRAGLLAPMFPWDLVSGVPDQLRAPST